MPRKRGFDPNRVLDDAMELFWAKGYEATSLDDLVAHTGVARAGLYSAFGDKRRLYLTALERYVQTRNAASDALLRGRPGGLAAVREVLERYASDALGQRRRGCLVVNSAITLAATDPDVAALVSSSWDTISESLAHALRQAQRDGDVSVERDPHALARMIVVMLQGLRVLATVGPSRPLVDQAVASTLASLTR